MIWRAIRNISAGDLAGVGCIALITALLLVIT